MAKESSTKREMNENSYGLVHGPSKPSLQAPWWVASELPLCSSLFVRTSRLLPHPLKWPPLPLVPPSTIVSVRLIKRNFFASCRSTAIIATDTIRPLASFPWLLLIWPAWTFSVRDHGRSATKIPQPSEQGQLNVALPTLFYSLSGYPRYGQHHVYIRMPFAGLLFLLATHLDPYFFAPSLPSNASLPDSL